MRGAGRTGSRRIPASACCSWRPGRRTPSRRSTSRWRSPSSIARRSTGTTARGPSRASAGGGAGYVPRGRVLGGSSSLNAMVYMRGNPLDYGAWGEPGWSWDEVLPLLQARRGQRARRRRALHGAGGPLSVSDNALGPRARGAGLDRGGDRRRPDHQRRLQRGAGRTASASTSYTRGATGCAARPRVGLACTGRSRARTSTLVPGAARDPAAVRGAPRAVGAEIVLATASRRALRRPSARWCSAPARYNTPQLLMLSGIGPAAHLREHGLDVLLDQAGGRREPVRPCQCRHRSRGRTPRPDGTPATATTSWRAAPPLTSRGQWRRRIDDFVVARGLGAPERDHVAPLFPDVARPRRSTSTATAATTARGPRRAGRADQGRRGARRRQRRDRRPLAPARRSTAALVPRSRARPDDQASNGETVQAPASACPTRPREGRSCRRSAMSSLPPGRQGVPAGRRRATPRSHCATARSSDRRDQARGGHTKTERAAGPQDPRARSRWSARRPPTCSPGTRLEAAGSGRVGIAACELTRPSRAAPPSGSARGGWRAAACAAPPTRAPRPSWPRCRAQRDLLVDVAARDVAQHLALARGELVELGVDHDRRAALAARERVEHEAGQARGEDGVAAGHAAHGVGQLRALRSSSSRSRARRRG